MARKFALLCLLLGGMVRAEENGLEAIPEQPDLPPPVRNGEAMEPDVTIIRKGGETIEEHRINNQLYMVRITPAIGPSYYLVDTNGDGNPDVRRSDNQQGMNINKWVLFSW